MMICRTITSIHVVNEANAHDHWRERQRRVRNQRQGWAMLVGQDLWRLRAKHPKGPWLVTFTRIAPRSFDDDGLAIAFKALRDETAFLLGHDDAPSSPITWRYRQERGAPKTHAVRLEVALADEGWVCPACEKPL